MSFLLVSESGAETGWTHFAWPIVRRLAEDSGWLPHGTLPPSDWEPKAEAIGAWDGRYTSNDGQLVTIQDASELAAALERAIVSTEFEHRIRQLNRAGTEKLQPLGLLSALDDDASSWRKDIESFVTFCRKGAFRIF
jgi:hypothetical protein